LPAKSELPDAWAAVASGGNKKSKSEKSDKNPDDTKKIEQVLPEKKRHRIEGAASVSIKRTDQRNYVID